MEQTQKNSTRQTTYKGFCYTNKISPLTQYVNSQVFQELPDKIEYFADQSDKGIYTDLRDSLGYTNEIENPHGNDSKLTLTIKFKDCLDKKKSG